MSAKKNRFDALLTESNNKNKEYLNNSQSPLESEAADLAAKKAEEESKEAIEPAKKESPKKVTVKEDSPEKKSPAIEKKEQVKVPNYIVTKVRGESRSVRKGFILTPSNATWLENLARETENSENEIINQLLQNLREKNV